MALHNPVCDQINKKPGIQLEAFSLRTQLLQRPISRMWNLLNATTDTTMTQVHLSGYIINQYSVASDPNELADLNAAMKNVTWAIFANRQTVRSMSITYKDGHIQAFDRGFKNNNTYYVFSLPSNSTQNTISGAFTTPSTGYGINSTEINASIWYKEQVSTYTGEPIGAITQIPPYDAIGNVWDASDLDNGEVLWHVSVSKNDDSALLSSGSPVRDRLTGTLLAVIGMSSELSSVSQLMKELAATNGGYIYLTSGDGLLLATSTESSLVRNSSSGPKLVPATESNDTLIRAGASWLRNNYGDQLLLQQDIHAEDVLLDGEKFYIDSFFLNLTRLPLVGVIILPRSYVMGEVDGRSHITLAILVSVAICILVIGCLLVLVLTSGVYMEMKLRAEVIKHLDARRRAEASSSYKSQFLANMSHELRTPMAAIIGLLDILLGDEDLPTEQISMVSQIRRCSMALLRLLNNILDLSKVESGKLVLEEADFDLRHDLEGLVDMFSVQCLDHDIEIILDLADDMPEIVRGDSTRTMQIFANLVANSIKFTSSGHIIIRAQTGGSSSGMNVLGAALGKKDVHFLPSKLENEKPYSNECGQQLEKIVLWFEIDDSGCGIDPSKWETIFESFVQADPSTTRTYGGTGLGLCIVRSLVRKMGGEIEVVKKEYAGTLIRLFLVFDHPLEMTPIPRNPHLLCFPSLLEKSRVLVAMRGKAGRSALVKWISNMGLQVLEASHWDEVTMIDELSQQDASSQTESSTDELSAATKSESLDQHESRKHEDKKQFLKMDKFITKVGPVEDVKILEDFASRLSVTVTSLAIIDIELFRWGTHPSAIPSATLDRFRDQGILISWLHSYNTSNSVKMELRKMGYSLMTNKPLYKSKLDSLFMSMLGLHKIEANEIHDPLLNPRFHNFHFDARDGLSPGSGMSFRLGALPSIDSFQQTGAQMNENSISGLSFQSCTDGSVDMIVEKHTSKEGRRADSNAKLSSLHERCAMTSIRNNQGLDSPVHQSGNAHDVETITGSFETNSTQRNRSCGVLCNHMTDFNKDVLPGVDGSCHLNDVESVSPADIPNSLLHSAHCHPHSPLSAPTKCSVSSILELQVDQILIQLENQSAGQALLGASTCQSPLSDPDHSQQIGGYCQSRNEMSKEVISADDCSLRRPCEITSSQELGEIVSLTQNDLSGESASAYEPPPHQIINPSWRIAHQSSSVRPRKLSLKKSNVCDDLNGIHILLAEDTPVLQRVATIMLEKMGASVIVVGDGLQAVDTLLDSHQNSEEQMTQSTQQQRGTTRMAALKFDLVLMDCQMPRMDGYDATIAIRNAEACTGRHIPIVALTAHAMSSDEAKCLQVGMDAYLTKPIDCKLLVMTILALTRKSN